MFSDVCQNFVWAPVHIKDGYCSEPKWFQQFHQVGRVYAILHQYQMNLPGMGSDHVHRVVRVTGRQGAVTVLLKTSRQDGNTIVVSNYEDCRKATWSRGRHDLALFPSNRTAFPG